MLLLNKFLQLINRQDIFLLASKMLLIFVLLYSRELSHHYFFLITAFLLVIVVVQREFFKNTLFWLLVASFFCVGIYTNFYNTGNHTFVTLYLVLLMLIASIFRFDSKKILELNSKILLAIIMFFAVLQKFLSKAFIDGSSLYYLNARGSFFRHLQRFFPESKTMVTKNETLLTEQFSSYESLFKPVELTYPNWFFSIEPQHFAYIILIVEILFFIFIFIKNQWLRNGFFVLFMLGLIGTREETGFASLLCILLLLQAQKDSPIFKLIYISLHAICISFIISKLGFF